MLIAVCHIRNRSRDPLSEILPVEVIVSEKTLKALVEAGELLHSNPPLRNIPTGFRLMRIRVIRTAKILAAHIFLLQLIHSETVALFITKYIMRKKSSIKIDSQADRDSEKIMYTITKEVMPDRAQTFRPCT